MALSDIIIGDTRQISMTFKDGNGTAIDISNMMLFITFKNSIDDLDRELILQKVYTFPADADSIAGLATVEITSEDTKLFSSQDYVYGFQLVDTSVSPYNVRTLEIGNVTASKGVAGADVIQVFVPDVIGLTEADATTALTAVGLVVGTVSTAVGNVDEVISTDPLFDTFVELGSSVDLVIGVAA